MPDNTSPFTDPLFGLNADDMTYMVIETDLFFDFLEKNGIKKPVMPEGTSTTLPLDLALSLLRPDELEKLKKYAIAYKQQYMSGEG